MSQAYNFVPHTEEDLQAMLSALSVDSLEDLYWKAVDRRFKGEFSGFDSTSEMEMEREFSRILSGNKALPGLLGGGFYHHFVPKALNELAGRAEFYTAYTPYQPEASQGTLQALYEYQSMMARLTAMEVANASVYDGGSAVFEAIMMSLRITNRNRVIVDELLNPIYLRMLETYLSGLDVELLVMPREEIPKAIDSQTSAVVLQMPDFLGNVFDLSEVADAVHAVGGLLIQVFYPISLGILRPPGEMGVDIAVGEGQSLGLGLNFGGPYLGIMATRKEFVRKMPGRIVGRTKDRNGRDCYVLTLQAREQHIRREKATSNVCSNESLCAIKALIYLSLMGRSGLRKVATVCHLKAKALRSFVEEMGLEVITGDYFNEFAVRIPDLERFYSKALEDGFIPGLRLEKFNPEWKDCLLVALTETVEDDLLGRWQDSLRNHIRT